MFEPGAARPWPLTVQMSLLVASAIALMLASVSGLMYVELVKDLRDKESAELRFDLQVQRDILVAAAAHRGPDYWQREWLENRSVYGRFAWQVLAADRSVRQTSANWPVFARALARVRRHAAFLDWALPGAALPRQVVVDTIGAERLAGSGGVLRGALDISHDVQVLRDYRNKLLTIGTFALVLSLALAWSLVRFGLAPLMMFARTVGMRNKGKVLPLSASERWPAELRQLATTFQGMSATLERSHAQASFMSARLAHELCAPIDKVLTASCVTLARPRAADEYQKTLELVVEEGSRLSRMLSGMLFLARADNGEPSPRVERLSLAAEFDALAEFFDAAFRDQGIALRASGACTVSADPVLLRRALSILLANALHDARAGDTVTLSCHAQQGTTVVSVAACCAVMSPAQLGLLSQAFHLARATGKAVDEAGIELAVVRAIAVLHGGSVSAVNFLEKGSRVDLYFPEAPGRRTTSPEQGSR
jgi:two-component system heavy metal sensor histidine kinase CusS